MATYDEIRLRLVQTIEAIAMTQCLNCNLELRGTTQVAYCCTGSLQVEVYLAISPHPEGSTCLVALRYSGPAFRENLTGPVEKLADGLTRIAEFGRALEAAFPEPIPCSDFD